jgi:hypothetical protein
MQALAIDLLPATQKNTKNPYSRQTVHNNSLSINSPGRSPIIVQNKLRTKSPFIFYYKKTVSVTVPTDRHETTEQKPPFCTTYMLWTLRAVNW